MGTYIIRDVQDFLIERWGQKQMRSDVDLQLAAHAKQVRLENAQLREQNRVLREALRKIYEERWTPGVSCCYEDDARSIYPAREMGIRNIAQAALTATSQEVL